MQYSGTPLPALLAALMLASRAGAAPDDVTLVSICTGDGARLIAAIPEEPVAPGKRDCAGPCHALCDRKKTLRRNA